MGQGLHSIWRLASNSDTYNRSSLKVEQILPSDEHVWDPRDSYASDSLVLIDFDLDQELYRSAEEFEIRNDTEVQDEHQGSNFVVCSVLFSCLAYAFITNWCEAFSAVASAHHSALPTLAAFVTLTFVVAASFPSAT